MKREEKEKDMYDKILAWHQSGMGMASYARSQGMSLSGFKYWSTKHRKEHKKENTGFMQIYPSSKADLQLMQAQRPPAEPKVIKECNEPFISRIYTQCV